MTTEEKDQARLEIKNISLETKNKLKLFCDSSNISMSDFVLTLIERSIQEKDLELVEQNFEEAKENPLSNIQGFNINIPSYLTEGERKVYDWVDKETKRILKDYNHSGYLTVDNLYVAEHMVKTYGFITQKVIHADPSLRQKKKWLLVQGKSLNL